ncbi:MAG: hypothetical protein KBT02_09020 [Treponema sp.]|nr:hypothetical protein [Candidatus Treponema caballi]
MTNKLRYRDDVETAVKLFRPVLRHLNLREPEHQQTVYLADEEQLDFIDEIGNVCISVLLTELKNISAAFLQKKTENWNVCYIVIDANLYKESLCDVKMAGVHEFCHFMALIYALSKTSISRQNEYFERRLSNKLDELTKNSFNNFIIAMSNDLKIDSIDELTNDHYQLGIDNTSIDYIELLKGFLFSKELFEEYFNDVEQHNFSVMWKSENKDTRTAAALRYKEVIDEAAKNKSVNQKLAERQAYKWAMDYIQAE